MTRKYENRDSPVTTSSDKPSARAASSALVPRCLKGSTATQKPSSALLAVACLTGGASARAEDAVAELERLERLLTRMESASPGPALRSGATPGVGREPAPALGSLEAMLRRRYQSHERRFAWRGTVNAVPETCSA